MSQHNPECQEEADYWQWHEELQEEPHDENRNNLIEFNNWEWFTKVRDNNI